MAAINGSKQHGVRKGETMWMTLDELTQMLKLGKTKIYQMARNGEIPAVKVDKQWRFDKQAVNYWMGTRHAVKKQTLFDEDDFGVSNPKVKRTQGGMATTDVILSAHVSGNANVFPQILELHVPKGATVADVTYGKAVW